MADARFQITRKSFLRQLVRYVSAAVAGVTTLLAAGFVNRFSDKKRRITVAAEQVTENRFISNELIIRRNETGLTVLSRKCPHLGCAVQFNDDKSGIVCPCHGSQFDSNGGYLKGPAKRDLTQLPYRFLEDGRLEVELS